MFSILCSAPLNFLILRSLASQQSSFILRPGHTVLAGSLKYSVLGSFILNMILILIFSSQPLKLCIAYSFLCSLITASWITNHLLALLHKEIIIFKLQLFVYITGILLFYLTWPYRSFETIVGLLIMIIFVIVVFQSVLIMKSEEYSKLWKLYKSLGRKDIYLPSIIFFVFATGLLTGKFFFWYFSNSIYDISFFSTLTIFSLSYIFVFFQINRHISLPYKSFTTLILDNYPLSEILQKKTEMIDGYKKIMKSVILFYGPLMTAFGYFILHLIKPYINDVIKPDHYIIIGFYFLLVFSIDFIMFHYLDSDMSLLYCCILLFFINLGLSIFMLNYGSNEYFGAGFCFGCLIISMVSGVIVRKRMESWDYLIFKDVSNDF